MLYLWNANIESFKRISIKQNMTLGGIFKIYKYIHFFFAKIKISAEPFVLSREIVKFRRKRRLNFKYLTFNRIWFTQQSSGCSTLTLFIKGRITEVHGTICEKTCSCDNYTYYICFSHSLWTYFIVFTFAIITFPFLIFWQA